MIKTTISICSYVFLLVLLSVPDPKWSALQSLKRPSLLSCSIAFSLSDSEYEGGDFFASRPRSLRTCAISHIKVAHWKCEQDSKQYEPVGDRQNPPAKRKNPLFVFKQCQDGKATKRLSDNHSGRFYSFLNQEYVI